MTEQVFYGAPEGSDVGSSAAVGSAKRRRVVARRFFRDRFALVGFGFLVLLVALAVIGPFVVQYGPNELSAGGAHQFEGRSLAHWLGTDSLARDNASRIIAGARYILRDSVEVLVATIAMALPIGVAAGYFGGWRDAVLMRILDALYSIPPIVLVLAVAQVTHQSLTWALFAVSVGFVPPLARLVRSSTMSVREEIFVEASLTIGTTAPRIILSRILPNVLSPVIVQASIIMSSAIFVEATLAILGVGYPVGSPAWGSMLNDAYQTIYISPSNMFYPGLAIALTVLAFNAVGDGLRDALGLDKSGIYGSKVSLGITAVVRPGGLRRRERTNGRAKPSGSETLVRDGPLLAVDNLTVEVQSPSGWLKAVDGVTFAVARGEILGIVGESGAGKSLTSLSLMRLLPSPPFQITAEAISFEGRDLLGMSLTEMRHIRGNDIAMIFQDPMSALNPAHTVGAQVAEVVRIHEGASRRAAWRRAVELLGRVGIPDPEHRAKSYPHEFSGGMRQRVMIAVALACSPKLLIADEPTTALDVTVQAQILDVLRSLKDEYGLSIIFITHDLGIVAEFCDRALVMYAGQIIEEGPVSQVFATPAHPYTEGLLGSLHRLGSAEEDVYAIPGQVPALGAAPTGCRFAPRCRYAMPACTADDIPLTHLVDRSTRCVLPALDSSRARA
jgi:peptide/nickel transport system permease protein